MSKSRLSRRQFLSRSLAIAGAGFAIGGTRSSGRVIGANDTIRVAVAGLNGRGGSAHVGEFGKMPDVAITYLVDPDTRTFAKRIHQTRVASAGMRRRPCRTSAGCSTTRIVDAVSIATPNHWHALMTIWACQAGKDVYVEKPCSHNVHEGRIAVEAARKYNRIVQHGTQSRSSAEWAQAVAAVQSGKLGKLLVSQGSLLQAARSRSASSRSTRRPARRRLRPLARARAAAAASTRNLVHYNWHWFWDFGNGDIGNQGVHQMDIARWMIPGADGPSATYPKTVLSLGGRFGYRDQGQTANTQISVMDFGETQLIFEVRGLKTGKFHGETVGNIAHLEEGTIVGGKFYPQGERQGRAAVEPGAQRRAHARAGQGPLRQLHRRRPQPQGRGPERRHPRGPLLGGPLPPGQHLVPARDGGPVQQADEGLRRQQGSVRDTRRMEEHLKENSVALDGLNYRLGRKLTFDAATESFVGDAEANQLSDPHYRAPFVVPDRMA